MSVRIGINPITWSNDDMPALGGDTPLEVCLAETRQAGYAGIEMGGKFPKTTEALRPVLDRHGLAFISGWYSAKLLERDAEQEIAAMQPHLDLMAGMGCAVMVFAEVSGDEGMIKPDPRIFRLLLERHALRAEDCVFIDDNAKNAAAADALGIHGVHFRNPAALRRDLGALGLL